MKKYFRDLDLEKKIEIILNNNDLREIVSEDLYNQNMEHQKEEGELMLGKEQWHYIDIKDDYNSFFLVLKSWHKFIDNLDKDYLCDKGLQLHSEIIKLKEEYDNIDIDLNEERFNKLEEELENKCKELLSICENQLHEYESFTEEDLKEFVEFNLEENNLFDDYYIIDDDCSKVFLDTTRTFI